MPKTHPHAEATYRVIAFEDGSFAVEVTIPDTNPTTVRPFKTEADAEAWIVEHQRRVTTQSQPVPSGHITDILNGRRSVTPIPRCGSAAISATARNSGSTCKANMILRSSSASGAQRSRSGCGQQARPDSSGCGAAYAPSIVLGGFEVTSGPASGASSNRN